ncbi:hypothetical protein LNN38_27275, partial [Pseudomonas sp. LA21]|uniref:hypothetical protein n=1 Tax=Pseudomonas sp. LA21 TaxID=2893373 RepID=UPI001FB6651C
MTMIVLGIVWGVALGVDIVCCTGPSLASRVDGVNAGFPYRTTRCNLHTVSQKNEAALSPIQKEKAC